MREQSKTWRYLTGEERAVIIDGEGIDIGCGNDKIHSNAIGFDKGDGDASRIHTYIVDKFDWVYSSHCLEDMDDPYKVFQDWWGLVNNGGYLFIIVPDEDLYEQGYFGVFNEAHRHSFTWCKDKSWNDTSINIKDLINGLCDREKYSVRLMDHLYNRNRVSLRYPKAIVSLVTKIRYTLALKSRILLFVFDLFVNIALIPIDQTIGDALAQWVIVVKKKAGN